jgi:TP901 family phage tail tape measure protein
MAKEIDRIYVRIGADISGLEKAMRDATSKIKGIGQQLTDIGKTLSAAVTLPIAAFGAATIKTAGDFQAAMNRVQAVSGATGDDLEKLTALAKDLGKTTVFSASEAAEGMGFLAQAGFKTEQILSSLPDVLTLATAGQLDLARAADIASNVMGQFGIAAEDTSRVTNLLAAVSSSANTDILQLSEAMKFLGPTANALKISLEETGAIIGVLGDAGIQGSAAGRALSTSLVNLSDPTKKQSKDLKALAGSAFNAKGEFIGMAQLLKNIETATASFSPEMRAAAVSAIFGAEAFQELDILLGRGSEKFNEYTARITNTAKAQEIAAIQGRGFNNALKTLGSAFEALQLAIADSGLLDFAQGIIEKVTGVIRQVSELNPELLKWGAIIAGVAAAIGPVLVILGTLATTVLPAVAAGFGVLLGPVGLVVAAIVAAAVAIVMNWEKVRDWFTNTGFLETFKNLAVSVFEFVSAVGTNAAKDIADFWAKYGGLIMQVAGTVFGFVVGLVNHAIKVITTVLGTAAKVISGDFVGAWKTMLLGVGGIIANLVEVWGGAASTIIKAVAKVVEKIPGIGSAISATMNDAAAAVSRFSASAADSIKDVTGVYEQMNKAAKEALDRKLALDAEYSKGLDLDRNNKAQAQPNAPDSPTKLDDDFTVIPPNLKLKPEKVTVEPTSLETIISGLEKALSAADVKSLAFGEAFDIVGEKSRLFKSALTQLIDEGFVKSGEELDNVTLRLQAMGMQAEPTADLLTDALLGVTEKMAALETKNIAFGDSFDLAGAKQRLFSESLTMFIDTGLVRTQEEIDAVIARMNEMGLAGETVGSVFSLIGEKMANSFASAANSVANGAQTIRQALRGIIKGFVSEGIAAVIAGTLKTYSITGPAAVAIAAGAGAAANALFESAIPKFASGGIVSGPTLGLMGEYAGASRNPEVIAPLSDLKGMLGGGMVQVAIEDIVLRGEDLRVIFDKTARRRGYTS